MPRMATDSSPSTTPETWDESYDPTEVFGSIGCWAEKGDVLPRAWRVGEVDRREATVSPFPPTTSNRWGEYDDM